MFPPMVNPMSPTARIALGLGLALLTGPSCDSPESSAATCPPTFASASGPAVYVSAVCGADSGDGTQAQPLRTLSAGVARAKAGTTVLAAAGTYSESVALPGGVSLAGFGKVRIVPFGNGISVSGPGQTTISGVTVSGAKGTGIAVTGTVIRLENVRVEATVAGAGGSGSGVAISAAAKVEIVASQLVGNAKYGVEVSGSGPTSIIDPLFHVDPRGLAGNVAIIDPLFLPHSEATGNGQGGVAIIDPLFAPAPDTTQPDLLLTATRIADNGRFGVVLQGASAVVQRSAIAMTHKTDSEVADGLSVQPGKDAARAVSVTVDKASILLGNARAGVMVGAAGDIAIDGEISHSGKGGIWAHGSQTTVRLGANAVLFGNTMIGVAVSEGAHLECNGARIAKAAPRKVSSGGKSDEMADGIGIYSNAHGSIVGSKLDDNPRAAVIASNCGVDAYGQPDVQVKDTAISGSKFQVVVQCPAAMAAVGGPKDATPPSAGGTDANGSDLVLQTSVCDEGAAEDTCTAAP